MAYSLEKHVVINQINKYINKYFVVLGFILKKKNIILSLGFWSEFSFFFEIQYKNNTYKKKQITDKIK